MLAWASLFAEGAAFGEHFCRFGRRPAMGLKQFARQWQTCMLAPSCPPASVAAGRVGPSIPSSGSFELGEPVGKYSSRAAALPSGPQ